MMSDRIAWITIIIVHYRVLIRRPEAEHSCAGAICPPGTSWLPSTDIHSGFPSDYAANMGKPYYSKGKLAVWANARVQCAPCTCARQLINFHLCNGSKFVFINIIETLDSTHLIAQPMHLDKAIEMVGK